MNTHRIEEKIEGYEKQLVSLKQQVDEGCGLGKPYSQDLVEHLKQVSVEFGMIVSGINPEAQPELMGLVTRMSKLMDEYMELRLRVLAIVAVGQRGLDS